MNDPVKFLAHREGDAVAVAVEDCEPGPAAVAFLHAPERRRIEVQGAIPLGHKVALVPLGEGDEVIEYGELIGVARSAIAPGDHVHVHNIRSARWQLTS